MENREEVIKNTLEYVKKKLEKDTSGHDYYHSYRVWKIAKRISKVEGGDTFIIELAALLHDVCDHKFTSDKESCMNELKAFLETQGLKREEINKIVDIISKISFSVNKTGDDLSIEARIVQDADRLDAMGAIGIARCFATGALLGRKIYDPEDKNNSINHFYEKLLLLKDLMNTPTARRIAEQRHRFMEQFLEEFYKEWEQE